MIDLINKIENLIKTDVNSIQTIVNKFAPVLQDIKSEKQILYLSYIINVSINYINENQKDLPKDWKAWAIICIKNLYTIGKINKEEDIGKKIDEFVIFWKSDYDKYCQDIISASEFDRDKGFVFRFEQKNR